MIILIIIINIFLIVFLCNKNSHSNFITKSKILIFILFGLLAAIASIFSETFLESILSSFFSDKYTVTEEGIIWDSKGAQILYNFFFTFIIVGITEELTKFFPCYLYINGKLNTISNEKATRLDCIIPFVIVGATFSVLEDVVYIFSDTTNSSIGFVRLITEVAGHLFWSLLIGEGFYRHAVRSRSQKILYKIKEKERLNYINTGMFSDNMLYISVAFNILMHGIYNFLLLTIPFLGIIFIIISYILFFKFTKNLINNDIEYEAIYEVLLGQNVYSKEEIVEFIKEINMPKDLFKGEY